MEVAFVDQGYTGEQPATDAKAHGIRLEVVKLPEAKKGFILLPKRWVVERSFGAECPRGKQPEPRNLLWISRFRRLALLLRTLGRDVSWISPAKRL